MENVNEKKICKTIKFLLSTEMLIRKHMVIFSIVHTYTLNSVIRNETKAIFSSPWINRHIRVFFYFLKTFEFSAVEVRKIDVTEV